MGGYDETHTTNDCDKCLKRVGIDNLHKVPILYKDCNDEFHPNMGNDYRQYFVCLSCLKKEQRILEGMRRERLRQLYEKQNF